MLEIQAHTGNSLKSFSGKARQFFLRSIGNLIRSGHQERNEATRALDIHIKSGLALVRDGKPSEATEIFTDFDKSALLSVNLDLVHYRPNSLHTTEDIVRASRDAACGSMHDRGGNVRLVTGAPYPSIAIEAAGIRYRKFSEFPDRYPPEAVHAFQQELAILQAEELAHELQDHSGGPIAGQKDHEADVAAYIYQQGVPLSTEYITRYQSRMDWYTQIHPERAAELQAFRETWGGL